MADNALSTELNGDTETSRNGTVDPKRWLELYGDYLFRYALIRVRNATLAEDLLQETLLAAFRAKDRFAGESTERSWLIGILKHKILDHFRQLKREQTAPVTDVLPPELDDRFDEFGVWKHDPALIPQDWGEDASVLVQRKEFMAVLKQCLGKLPSRSAQAFVLREMEGTDSAQIQETLGVSPSNFWVLLHRARMQLRLCLEQNWLKL